MMESMDLIERIRKIRGADAALGLRFSCTDLQDQYLAVGSEAIGYTDSVCFCRINGYLDTVFAVCPGCEPMPIAYNITEFIRLILACGSAGAVISAVWEPFGTRCHPRSISLCHLGVKLGLEPISDPRSYIRTVRSVIDCSRITTKQGG